MKTMRTRSRNLIIHTIGLMGLLVLSSVPAFAQLTVTPQPDLQSLANSLEGSGVTIQNPIVICHAQGYGEFIYSGNALGANEGVLLTTGTINNAYGPNNVSNRTFQQNTAGDALLNVVTSRTTYDACRLEFDVIPSGDSIKFDFVFASEEYNEWVGSQYNDVFGFFISGPGITGDPGIGNEKNIALIPGTPVPVSINNVNNGSNSQFFNDNTGGSQIQYDGFTKNLHAASAVQPCATYHLKIVVADASDRMFDSGLFIQKMKSNAVTMASYTMNGIPELVEGCNPGYVRFSRAEATAQPEILTYYIQGSAINGVDFAAIGNTDPNVPKQVTIPAGATYVDVPIDPMSDGLNEGPENVRFILGNPNCPTAQSDTIDVWIEDLLPASVIPGNSTICQGGSVQFNADGGTSYSWTPATSLSATNIADPIASPTVATTYSVTITNGACSRTITRTITVVNISLSAVTTRPLCNGQSNGAVNLSVSGGTAPYMFNWTGPNGFTSTAEDLINISSGTFTVTVTDANDCSRVQSFNVNTPAVLSATSNSPVLVYGQNIACNGALTGSIDLVINGGTAPYGVVWSGPNGSGAYTEDLSGIRAGTYTATVTDVNGCTTSTSRTLTEPPAMQPLIENVTHVACRGNSSGSATATISGGMPPYSYTWNTSPVQITPSATSMAAGVRTVTITDGYGCTSTPSITITQPAAVLSVSLTGVSNVVQCQGQNNPHGSGTAVGSGGTAPYSYSWNTFPVQTTATAEFNSGGTYFATVTDANGCTASTSVSVTQPGESAITVTETNNIDCAGANSGSATVTLTGGSNVQSIVWNTNPPQYGTTLTNVPAGTYNAIAQHANGCQSAVTVTLTGPSGGALGTPSISGSTGVNCFGDGNGSVNLNTTGGTAPYSYNYNGNTIAGNILSGLSAGDHSITVTDANGCASTGLITVTGPTSPLTVSITQFTNVLCSGSGQGTATAQAAGGTGPYTYEWNSTPTQSASEAIDLPQGTYTVTATDANGCSASANVTIGGPQFGIDGMIESYGHVSCFGANDGFATITVWGGSNSFTATWNTQPPQVGFTATGLAPGLHMVEVIDNNGCDAPKFLYVDIHGPTAPLTHSIEVSNFNGWNTSCAGASNGWIDVTVSGGNEPYSYQWTDDFNNVAGMEDPAGLDAGTYYLRIIDAFGCVVNDTVIVTEPPLLALGTTLSIFPGDHNVSCAGAIDGSVDLTIIGGVSPYTTAWSNNQGFSASTEDLGSLGAGIYNVLVTDVNGCTANASVMLTSPLAINIAADISDHNGYNVSCSDAADGMIDLSVIGGQGPYSFEWNDGSSFEDLESIAAGIYSVEVTDWNGCTAVASYSLSAPEALDLDLDVALMNGGYG
ncbi:MAG: choice-of-anchor L domain-containing protein, partial [Bacteroidota bacterium]|nr:choice-of-anchor L domain-containing protein [Bacteroidota bacterium]